MCQVLEVSRSGYYSWRKRPKNERKKANERLLKEIKDSYNRSRGLYGVRKITKELNNKKKIKCGHNRVYRLMKENGIASKRPRRFKATTNSKHNYPVAENLLNQNFKVNQPNKVWVSDITYVPTDEGWLYFAAIIDLCHKKVVGWSMDSTMTKELVINALEQAVHRARPPKGVIHHSDRGSQYASHAYQTLLKKYGFIASMSRKGNCYDNACAEFFFSTLKNELIYQSHFKTREEARQAIFEYVEVFYNRIRLHSSLGYMSPCEYEQYLTKQLAA
ncbi:putative transposase [Desulforamulus putei DSM 12395]|uniref:Putative transposase n=2 Tax=Desulforamulus putei TaxID=74701 RepID=A0A1M5CC97_9FIRM|nr:putative transposase [Desulforamulus putei DSM 12395]